MNKQTRILIILFFNWLYVAQAQPYLLENNDSIKQKIADFFQTQKPEIWFFHRSLNDLSAYKDTPCSDQLYKPLKEYDSVYLHEGYLKISFLNGEEALLSFREKPSFLKDSKKCILLYAPPLGWGETTGGAIWGNIWIKDDYETWIEKENKGGIFFELMNKCYSDLELVREMEMELTYWNDFDDKLKNADLKTRNADITEEQRKSIVIANAANDKKDYESALKYYNEALEFNPFNYPDAYFNMALIAANMGNYRLAIANMKKYILLNPNANDTRKAQDKIYEWEYLNQNKH